MSVKSYPKYYLLQRKINNYYKGLGKQIPTPCPYLNMHLEKIVRLVITI